MRIKEYLRLIEHYSPQLESQISIFQNEIDSSVSYQSCLDIVPDILDILHDAMEPADVQFINAVFFEFYLNRKNLNPHKKRIFNEMERSGAFVPNSIEEKVHLVKTYRDITADLIDPYFSLFVACQKAKKGEFVSFLNVNLGIDERKKYNFLKRWIQPKKLLDGYDPKVRNSITHSGTHGIVYKDDSIVFRTIKRGENIKKGFIKWSTDEMIMNILSLIKLVKAVDISIEIFGIDIGNKINSNKHLSHRFIDEIIEKEQKFELQGLASQFVKKVNGDDAITEKGKIEHLTNLLFLECGKRDIPINCAKFNNEKNLVLIEIPEMKIDIEDQKALVSRLSQLLRYGIIGEPCYRGLFSTFIIREISNGGREALKVVIGAKELREYGEEKAGIYNLLNSCQAYLFDDYLSIEVDFKKIEEDEYLNLGRIFPRKDRF